MVFSLVTIILSCVLLSGAILINSEDNKRLDWLEDVLFHFGALCFVVGVVSFILCL